MDVLPALAGIAAWSGVTALMLRCSSAGAEVIGPMFGTAAEPGWPHGVQEDDDFHWSWDRPKEAPGEDVGGSAEAIRPSWHSALAAEVDDPFIADLAMPELIELPPGSGAPTTWPARPH